LVFFVFGIRWAGAGGVSATEDAGAGIDVEEADIGAVAAVEDAAAGIGADAAAGGGVDAAVAGVSPWAKAARLETANNAARR
jgi:hypothetical protein